MLITGLVHAFKLHLLLCDFKRLVEIGKFGLGYGGLLLLFCVVKVYLGDFLPQLFNLGAFLPSLLLGLVMHLSNELQLD
jgi:hypothetical protein